MHKDPTKLLHPKGLRSSANAVYMKIRFSSRRQSNRASKTYWLPTSVLRTRIINGNFRLYVKNPILFKDPIFDETFCFMKYFQDHFDAVFQKYSTYTDEENSILYNTAGRRADGVAVFSLKYHLANRKALAEVGIDVPFYLNRS